MDGLPQNFDFSVFLGRKIEGINLLSKFQVGYFFEQEESKPNLRINIESNIYCSFPEGSLLVSSEDFLTQANILTKIIGATVKLAKRRNDGGLLLVMSDNTKIEISVQDSNYEAFQIYVNEEIFVA